MKEHKISLFFLNKKGMYYYGTGFAKLEEKIEDKLLRHMPSLHFLIDALAVKVLEKMVDFFGKYKERKFHVPTSLKKAWNME